MKTYIGHADKDGLIFLEEHIPAPDKTSREEIIHGSPHTIQKKVLWMLANKILKEPQALDVCFKTELKAEDAYSINCLVQEDKRVAALQLLKEKIEHLDVLAHLITKEEMNDRWVIITGQKKE